MKVRESGVRYSEKETMKSPVNTPFNRSSHVACRLRFAVLMLLSFIVVWFGSGDLAFSEMTDREFETQMVAKKRDFNEFLKHRLKSSEQEVLAARAHSEKRLEDEKNQRELEASYRRKMKRYSMEEIEQQDRAYEERLRLESAKVDSSRSEYITRRDRHRAIEKSVSPVDSNLELEIDMKKEPDFKSSHPVDPLSRGRSSF